MPGLVTLTDPRSPAAEAYRTLRTNIRFSSMDHPARTLLLTSAGADEGKSTTLGNLAVTIAQSGVSAVVVDCDLRHPSVHQLFDLANDKGLTTALLDGDGGELPLQQTAVPGLRVLTSGPLPPNPADLIGTQRMQRVIDSLAEMAEVVLFDSPPVSMVADAAMLASQLDGVILVISAGKTKRDTAARAKAVLEKVNARVLGVVLNNARVDSNLYRYYNRGSK
ncbi:MAG TPA: CpsD/CapB family tyrosine-protein kinase [Chloroflexota bacterium]